MRYRKLIINRKGLNRMNKEEAIKMQVADTEDLVTRGVIDGNKLSIERIFTMVTSREPNPRNQLGITKQDVIDWCQANRPDIH
jgi:hypothetical protein